MRIISIFFGLVLINQASAGGFSSEVVVKEFTNSIYALMIVDGVVRVPYTTPKLVATAMQDMADYRDSEHEPCTVTEEDIQMGKKYTLTCPP